MTCPCLATSSPNGVGLSGRLPLTNSGSPSRCSIVDIVREIEGCEMPSWAAASVTPPYFTTAAIWIRWRSSNFMSI